MTHPKIVLIVVYIGQLPQYFNLWLASCRANPSIEWLLFSDDQRPFPYPKNVKHLYTTFDQIKARIQGIYNFKIYLEDSIKLSDYKTAYGEIFEEEIKGYDFWGYCDIDVIWGDLRKFIQQYELLKYDKASDGGHFTLYKNTPELRTLYRRAAEKGLIDYRKVFTIPGTYAIDEWGSGKGVNAVFLAYGKTLFYEKVLYADIDVFSYNLQTSRARYGDSIQKEKEKHKIIYQYLDGSLYQHYTTDEPHQWFTQEEMYIHFQKREMKLPEEPSLQSFLIVPPNKVVNWDPQQAISYEVVDQYGALPRLYWKNVFKNFKKKFSHTYIRQKALTILNHLKK